MNQVYFWGYTLILIHFIANSRKFCSMKWVKTLWQNIFDRLWWVKWSLTNSHLTNLFYFIHFLQPWEQSILRRFTHTTCDKNCTALKFEIENIYTKKGISIHLQDRMRFNIISIQKCIERMEGGHICFHQKICRILFEVLIS